MASISTFGHDGVLMAILTNLQAGTWAREASNSKEALQSWKYWDIPMGANLQMIFYQSEGNPDVLVKFMLNEKDLRLRWKRLKHLITNGMRFINSI